MSSRLMTVEDVAEHLGVAPKTIYQNWKMWQLKGVRIGGGTSGALRFRLRDVERLAQEWETAGTS